MQLTLALLSAIALVSAAPADIQRRAEATCGSHHYTSAAVSAASNAACNKIGGDRKLAVRASSYPHEYHNYEGFNFKGLSGPFYEFPILSSGKIYSSGSPGADRVIITESCQQAGVITHTGASGNNFVACSGTS